MSDEWLRLRAERDELNTKYEELLDEFRQVRKDVDSARAKMALQEETMEEYETEVKKEIDGLKGKCKAQEETIRQLNAKLQNQTCVSPEEMEELRSEKIALQEQLSAARGRVRELEEQVANESICSSGFEPAANHEDLVKISQLEEEKNVALERATHFEARIGRLTAEMEDLQETCNGLLNANRKLTDENKTHIDRLNEMEKQLSDALLPEQKHAKRGNSIYAEVSEGYDLLKEDLKKCFRDNQSLVRTNANLRRELAHEREKAIFAVNSTCSRQQNCDGCGELMLQLKIEQEKKRSTEKLYESLLKRNLTEMLAEVKKNPSQCLTQFAAELTQLKILVDSRFSTIDDLRLKLDDCTVINNQLKREKKNLEASLETAMKIQERLKTQCAVMQKRHEKEFAEFMESLQKGEDPNLAKKRAKAGGASSDLQVYDRFSSAMESSAKPAEAELKQTEDNHGPTPLKKYRIAPNRPSTVRATPASSRMPFISGSEQRLNLSEIVRTGSAQKADTSASFLFRSRHKRNLQLMNVEPVMVSFDDVERKTAKTAQNNEGKENDNLLAAMTEE